MGIVYFDTQHAGVSMRLMGDARKLSDLGHRAIGTDDESRIDQHLSRVGRHDRLIGVFFV